jgi:hypothetical protein
MTAFRISKARNEKFLARACVLCMYRVIKSLCAPDVGTYPLQQITPLSQQASFLPHYFAQSDCLAADRRDQGGLDTHQRHLLSLILTMLSL